VAFFSLAANYESLIITLLHHDILKYDGGKATVFCTCGDGEQQPASGSLSK